MFGYLIANLETLTKEEKINYRAQYCGLCHYLQKNFGLAGRSTLTYDLTFVNMILADISHSPKTEILEVCPVHMIRKNLTRWNEYTDYCSKANLYLSYYKYIDDVNDDNSIKGKRKTKQLQKYIEGIEKEYPELTKVIKDQLSIINQMEKDNVMNPDLPANAFGVIMSQLFIEPYKGESKENLAGFGYHLGRFIYLMDAVIDFKSDIKKQRYNPLLNMRTSEFEEMLLMVMEDVNNYYNQLPLSDNKTILDNIVYSGIWSKYQWMLKKERKHS